MSKPTILIGHGSWQTPAHWVPMRDLLHSHNYPTACPPLPTSGSKESITAKEDVQVIKQQLDRLVVTEEKDVIILSHSMNGLATSQATIPEYGVIHRAKEGKRGGVKHIVYLCAYLVPEGVQLGENEDGSTQPWPDFMTINEEGRVVIDAETLYADLSTSERQKWTAELVPIPSSATIPLKPTYAAWRDTPSTYLFCESDQTVPIALQEMMVDGVEKAGGSLKHERCGAGHSPYLTHMEKVLEIVHGISGV